MGLGTVGNQYIIAMTAPAANRTYTIKDMGADSDFAFTSGAQTFTNKTITDVSNTVSGNNLRTATGTVDISSSPAPTAGQVLIATSGTAATWQTLSAVTTNYNVWTSTATVSLANNTTAQNIISATGVGNLTIAPNVFTAGSKLSYIVEGTITVSSSTTFTMIMTAGGTNFLSIPAASNTFATGTWSFKVSGTVVIRTVGASGTFMTDYTSYKSVTSGSQIAIGTYTTGTFNTTASTTIGCTFTKVTGTVSSWSVNQFILTFLS
jgi:hypothetical protein